MRLISMSIHSRLRNQKQILQSYANHIAELATQYPVAELSNHKESSGSVILLISSQKGLCGAFNEQLFRFISQEQPLTQQDTVIAVGKYAVEYVTRLGIIPAATFTQMTGANFANIASSITSTLRTLEGNEVIVLSNHSRTFFSQKPTRTIIPFAQEQIETTAQYLAFLRTKTTIMQLLYDSLIAEQAARFISMDVAFRNADELLSDTKLSYNKARQAAVTRELLELSGSMA